ncbi:MAG: DUF4281 domain-containing protein [Bacteroidetes bacterium]|nr:MAG: DUF4281 domain-containing protein [Bacteroidota bacterium]
MLMSADKIFQLCSTLAMLGWIILILIPGWLSSDKVIIGIIITIFALIYSWLLFSNFDPQMFKKFGSLPGVMDLFRNPVIVTAGWIHYLAFDLMTGLFIKKNSLKHGISHWLLIIPLFLTFMVGPVGLLLYLIIRWIATRQYFAENF